MSTEAAVFVRSRVPVVALLGLAVVALGLVAHASFAAGDDSDMAALIKVLKDSAKDTSAKGEACLKLMDMGARAEPAVPALIDLLKAKDQDMRDYAITTLKKIGPSASASLSALKKVAAEDPSEDIRQLAEDAVKVIGVGQPKGDDGKDKPAKPAKPEKTAKPEDGNREDAPRPKEDVNPPGPGPRKWPPYDMSLMTMVFPELAKAPAPDWVKPGVQFTFYCAAATIAGDGPVFQLDPQGELVASDGSGRRYTIKPGGRITNDLLDAGHSGHGYAEYTIVSVDRDTVAVAVEVYTISGGINAARLSNRSAFVGAAGSTADLWVNPEWLAKVKPEQGNLMYRTVRMPYVEGNKTRKAVAFAGNDGSMVFIYDEETGVLLYRGGSGEGEKGENLMINGVLIPNKPSRMLTLSKYLGRRTPKLPWAKEKSPDWASTVKVLNFVGDCGLRVQGSPNIPLPLRAEVMARSRGEGWVRFHLTQAAGGANGALPVMTSYDWLAGSNQLGGVWIAPNALAKLKPGEEIDTDPETQIVTRYEGQQREPNGAEVLMITRANKGQTLKYGYDRRTGILSYFEQADHGLAGSMVSRASLAGKE